MRRPDLIGSVVALAAIIGCQSCVHKNAVPPPAAAAPAQKVDFPAPPPGEKTEAVTRILDLFSTLRTHGRNGSQQAQKVGFRLSEQDVNEYLAYSLRVKPRPGVGAVLLKFLPQNQISALVVIDFSTVQSWNAWIIPAPLHSLLNGKLPVQVDLQFRTDGGILNFDLKGFQAPDGTSVLRSVMADIIQDIGLHQPELFNTGQAIPLPYGLTRVWTESGILAGET